MAFLINILRKAYFNGRQFGLLFQPPLARIQEKRSSRWSWENLYANRYLNGLLSKQSICVAIEIVDFIQATKAMTKVVREHLESGSAGESLVFKDRRYWAIDKKISFHVFMLCRRVEVS